MGMTSGRVVAESSHWGFFYDDFSLTLAEGRRTEILGPVFSREFAESATQWTVPPLFSLRQDGDLELTEWDLLYPLVTFDRYGAEFRLQVAQWLSFSGGQNQAGQEKSRFTLFPVYFQQRSDDPDADYTALFPIYGHINGRFFRDEIAFTLFPLYGRTRKRDVVTQNFLYPMFHLRTGEELHGWQFWPLFGREEKAVTSRTNQFGEVETVGGHEKVFAFWPLFFDSATDLGTDNPKRQQALLPIYSSFRSPQRDSTTYLWPFGFTTTDDREKKYHEWGAPWPLVVFARGEGKHTSRVWPLFSRAANTNQQKNFYLWPVYKYNRLKSPPLDLERTRIFFFLYSDLTEKNTATGAAQQRRDLWPLFTRRREFSGNSRLQILSLLEPVLPNNKSIERNYSPLWSLWRAEQNARTGARSQSLLWNLYRRDTTPADRNVSLLFGVFQYHSDADGRRWRLFHLPARRANDRKPGGAAAAGH